MKTILLLLLTSISTAHAEPKTCKAFLGGSLNKNPISIPDPKVIYPDGSGVSKPAKWQGELKPVAYIAPLPVEVECGKPYLDIKFESLSATGLLPEAVVTLPWEMMTESGKLKKIPSETIYGYGSSYDYPFPPTSFETTEEISISNPLPDGITDVCKAHKINLILPITQKATIRPDPVFAQYFMTTPDGLYSWDSSASPNGVETELKLENPYVNIICDSTWEYEATFEWPFEFNQMDGMCKGGVERTMKLKGEFALIEDNKITGYIEVTKPELITHGAVTGSFSGKDFSSPVEGVIYNDESGKSMVDLEFFQGGDGINFNFKLSCFGGDLNHTQSSVVVEYLKILNFDGEKMNPMNPGFFMLDSNGEEKTFVVDKGGAGIITIHRTWKKKN
jgi:hypothetical protein